MTDVYRLEYWRFHNCVETKEFIDKKKAQKWLKKSGWWLDWEYGNCSIYIYKNGQEIDWIHEDKGWFKDYFNS